jgi:flagellar biosynthesis anti-sigma factor FlgM
MKVNDNISLSSAALGNAGAARTQDTERTGSANGFQSSHATSGASDDVHLSELVRSLRSLAADSPERQAKIEQLARSYATGNYRVDANATASSMIDDSMKR